MSTATHIKPASEKHIKKYAHYLAPGEKMLYFTGLAHSYLYRKFAIRFLFPGVIIIIVLTAGGYFLGFSLVYSLLAGYLWAAFVALVANYLEAKGTQYILTNKRLIVQLGYFNISLTSAVYDKITHVEVQQGFIERTAYRYGRIVVHTAGSQNQEIIIKNIAHPIKFKNILERLVDEAQANRSSNSPRWKQTKRKGMKNLLKPIAN